MPLSTEFPIALLPIRIETRFFGDELRVRVFPDAVHIDTHDPVLAEHEVAARDAWTNGPRDLDAWRTLVATVGGARAEYIAAGAASPPRPRPWTEARLLPAHWNVVVTPFGADGVASEPVRASASPIVRPLAVSPDPEDPGDVAADRIVLGGDAAWLTSYAAAVERGMAVTIPLGPAATADHYTVLVYGIPDGADDGAALAAAGAAELAEVLAAHRFTDGLGFLDHGTPTNHTGDEAPPWRPLAPPPEESFSRVTGPGATAPTSAATSLADALGVGAEALTHAEGAEREAGVRDEDAGAMQALLWPATLGYFLEQMLDGALPREPAMIEDVRGLFVDDVRNRGPLPVLRVGRNPYGVLPVTALAAWQPREGERIDPRVIEVLRSLLATWLRSAAGVPRIGADGDRVEALAHILGQEPVSTAYVARSVLGAAYTASLYDFIRKPLGVAWWTRLRSVADRGWSAVGLPPRAHRLGRAVFADEHVALAAPAVDGAPSAAPLPYLEAMRTATLPALQSPEPGPGAPLLHRLARHSLLAGYLAASRHLLEADGDAGPFLDPEMIGMKVGPRREPVARPWSWLDRRTRSNPGETVGQTLDGARAAAPDPAFAAAWAGLARIAPLPGVQVDALFREALDLCAHRIDAWATAVANRRLARMRTAAGDGIYVGGYGWVENLRRDNPVVAPQPPDESGPMLESTRPGGFVLAPSPAHATTAALLRNGFLAHRANAASPFAVDLSSARARVAAAMLDGVRAGVGLGELLGQRFERALVDNRVPVLGHLVDSFRSLAGGNTSRIVDGLELLETRGTIPWGTGELPEVGSPQHAAIVVCLDDLAAVLDATADLLVAESVHQLALGNPARAGGVADAVAHGEPPPRELQVLEHRARGAGVEHRVLALVPGAAAPPRGWANTPRALGEPALEGWSAALFGAPNRYHARAVFREGTAEPPLGTVELTLADLGIAALDAVLGAADLRARALDAARAARPAGVPETATIAIERHGDRLAIDDAALLAGTIRDLLARARAARATDLGHAAEPAPDPADVAELAGRLPDTLLADALTLLAGDPHGGLLAAAGLGVAGAVPDVDPARWPAQVECATAALRVRQARLPAPDPVARLRVLLGDDFVVAPRFRLPAGAVRDDIAAQVAGQPALIGDDPTTPATWLTQMGAVREPLASLERAVLLADTFAPSADAALDLRVAQLPHRADAPWIGRAVFGRAPDADPPDAKASFVLHAPLGLDVAEPLAGLAIDGWSEVVPDARVTTGLAFQYDQPGAQAPQAILLAVPPDAAPAWTAAAVEQIVREAIELVHCRAVDGDLLHDAGHYLPGIYLALNLAGDTASTDFFPGTDG